MNKRWCIGVVVLLFGLPGCDTQKVRTGYPRFEATQPFEELAEGQIEGAGAEEEEEDTGASDFERAIAREQLGAQTDGEPAGAGGARAAARPIQRIALGNVFVAEVPARYDEWTFASQGDTTMITHQLPGQPADALIYVEGFGAAARTFPSFEVGRFMITVDPTLAPNVVFPPMAGLAGTWAKEQGVPPVDMMIGLQMALTRTGGMGVGYRSEEGSFTGWRWAGRNDLGVTMRLGRTFGTWGSPSLPGSTNMVEVVGSMVHKAPQLAPILEHIQAQIQTSQTQGRVPTAAWMILGSMTRATTTTGAHIAILCVQRPVCPVARELSQILATVKPAGVAEFVSASNATLDDVARSVGVELLPLDKLVSAPQMLSQLEQALRQGRGIDLKSLPSLPAGTDVKEVLEQLPGGSALPGDVRAPKDVLKKLPEGLPKEIREAIEGQVPPSDKTPKEVPAGVPLEIPGQ